jgi:hypothetical protein
MHYCGDDFQRFNVFSEYKTCCESNTPMPGCCDDVSNLELPNSDQQVSDLLDFHSLSVDLPNQFFYSEYLAIASYSTEKTAFTDSSPPIFQNTPIYIFCQVFLI